MYGDYVAFYKQALRYGLFDKMKVASTIAFGVAPHAIGKDHPGGCAGRRAIPITISPILLGDRWPQNKSFVERYLKRRKEYPNFQSVGAYTALNLLKNGHRAGQQADRRLARGRGDHQPARGPRDGYPVGLSLHAA